MKTDDLTNCRRQPPDFEPGRAAAAQPDLPPANNIETVIVGTKFRGRPAIAALRRLQAGQEIQLRRETHPKDVNAVQCIAFGIHIGYVPKVANPRVAAAMDAGAIASATVTHRAVVFDSGFIKHEAKIRVTWD